MVSSGETTQKTNHSKHSSAEVLESSLEERSKRNDGNASKNLKMSQTIAVEAPDSFCLRCTDWSGVNGSGPWVPID